MTISKGGVIRFSQRTILSPNENVTVNPSSFITGETRIAGGRGDNITKVTLPGGKLLITLYLQENVSEWCQNKSSIKLRQKAESPLP